jgi:hypothetical protein
VPGCEACANDSDKSFTIEEGGEKDVFDIFECAIQALTPRCGHRYCKIIGHGIEAGSRIYCCANVPARLAFRRSLIGPRKLRLVQWFSTATLVLLRVTRTSLIGFGERWPQRSNETRRRRTSKRQVLPQERNAPSTHLPKSVRAALGKQALSVAKRKSHSGT